MKKTVNHFVSGIDFAEATQLWLGKYKEFTAKNEYENRYAIIGKLEAKFYTCIFCIRNDRIRIISCRRSRKKEVMLYEKNTN